MKVHILFKFKAMLWESFYELHRYNFAHLLKGGIHSSAHVSVLSRAYCFLTNQWRVDFREKFTFVNRGYAVVTAMFRVIDFFAFDSEISSLWKRNASERYCHRICKCNGVCSRKDGSKAKGCPCKTRGILIERCKCLATGKNCQNRVAFLLSYSLTSYFSCFRCIPNNSTQRNDHSNVF